MEFLADYAASKFRNMKFSRPALDKDENRALSSEELRLLVPGLAAVKGGPEFAGRG
jgi:hypothetical protein